MKERKLVDFIEDYKKILILILFGCIIFLKFCSFCLVFVCSFVFGVWMLLFICFCF